MTAQSIRFGKGSWVPLEDFCLVSTSGRLCTGEGQNSKCFLKLSQSCSLLQEETVRGTGSVRASAPLSGWLSGCGGEDAGEG